MISKLARKALLLCALATGSANAATVGSLDNYRTYADSITGGDYSGMVSGLEALGHTFAPAARDLTPAYLDSVDVFMNGRHYDNEARLRPQGTELADLKDWVIDGGIFVQFGGNYIYSSSVDRWIYTFGLDHSTLGHNGGTWETAPHAWLDGVTGGSGLGATNSGDVSVRTGQTDPGTGLPLVLDTFASYGSYGAVVGVRYGQGYVLAFGDENPVWGNAPNAGAITFLNNVLSSTDVAPVPLPAGLPLLLAALAGLGLMRRRKSAV